MTSVSSNICTPIDLRNACVNASVLDISSENTSEADMVVKGVSSPSCWASPIAMAVLPVPGFPARRMARPPIYIIYILRHHNSVVMD